ncbi:MAG TPA: hypothetical protein VNX87_22170 [Candidatus Sulfotelmatobacter sp.]|nr:hypothetical protein [Candidatus Sulfotelmatobacter sp.]
MADLKARQLYDQGNFVELFKYIEPMWIVVILQILDDLFDRGFIPNPDRYQDQLRQAGIFVKRLEVAMAAVVNKHGRSITWGKFWEVQQDRLSQLPLQQKREIHEYWFSGPNPGLYGGGDQTPPVIGTAGDWFVTDFSGTTTSVVVTVGFTAITGNITFASSDGTKYSNAIGIMGPSVGVSVIPGAAKALGSRFPGLRQLLFPESVPKLSNDLLKWLTSGGPVARTLWSSPVLMRLANTLPSVFMGTSVGPTTIPSFAIGLVVPNQGRTLKKADFSGSCVVFSALGNAAVFGAGIFALAFGLERAWNPISDPSASKAKGYALISAASVSAQIPNLGASETIYWGEIV